MNFEAKNPISSKTILIVDDDKDIREAISEILKYEGFETMTAENGKAALQCLEGNSHCPDLILLDLMMPVMDGWQFRLQQTMNPRWESVPVVIISAGGNVEQKAANLGARGWIKKPLQIENLLEEVSKSLSET